VVEEHGTFVVDSLAGRTLRVYNQESGAQLAVSRAFGDYEFGEVVTANPTVSFVDLARLPPPTAECSNILILACDGIWDVTKDERAVEVARQAGGDMTKASVLLRDYAYLRDSGDDLTVICVCLDRLDSKKLKQVKSDPQ
jgi:protein phosphatase PTC1